MADEIRRRAELHWQPAVVGIGADKHTGFARVLLPTGDIHPGVEPVHDDEKLIGGKAERLADARSTHEQARFVGPPERHLHRHRISLVLVDQNRGCAKRGRGQVRIFLRGPLQNRRNIGGLRSQHGAQESKQQDQRETHPI